MAKQQDKNMFDTYLEPRQALSSYQQLILSINLLKARLKQCIVLGLIHNDIKPENSMVDADFNIRFVDYSSRIKNNGTRFGVTLMYIPPGLSPELRKEVIDIITSLIQYQPENRLDPLTPSSGLKMLSSNYQNQQIMKMIDYLGFLA